eukprot:g16761.t1
MTQAKETLYREFYLTNADVRDKYEGVDPPDELRLFIGSDFGLSIHPNSPTTAGIVNSCTASPTAARGISCDPAIMENQGGGKQAPHTPTSRLRRSVGLQDSPKAGFSPLVAASSPLIFTPGKSIKTDRMASLSDDRSLCYTIARDGKKKIQEGLLLLAHGDLPLKPADPAGEKQGMDVEDEAAVQDDDEYYMGDADDVGYHGDDERKGGA